jgi:FKBP-type peptidyl-prolyl cis-trans isomerase
VEEVKVLCDAACASGLESTEMVTTPSGLQYRDIVVGTGPQAQVGPAAAAAGRAGAASQAVLDAQRAFGPPSPGGTLPTPPPSPQTPAHTPPQVGYQAVVHYVAMLPTGRIFENSLERGAPFDIR